MDLRDMLPTKAIAVADCSAVAALAVGGITGNLDTAAVAVVACNPISR